jgi:16S rRNA (guanine966-N2)-methyltransferase
MSIRITGGLWRGRLLEVPKKGVRPTQDRVRAAVFSSLQDVIPGARVLDLFAGTGAFGLEALSRGAASACFVENDRAALACLQKNVELLLGAEICDGAERINIVNSDVGSFLEHNHADVQSDIVFADPPYDSGGEWTKKILFHLSRGSILMQKGYLIVESRAKSPPVEAEGWSAYWVRSYGETRICIYRFTV